MAFNPSLQIASQSSLDCSEAAGEVNSICVQLISTRLYFANIRMTHIVDSKIVQRLCNFNLLLEVEEGVGELLSFTQCTLNDFEIVDIAQEVANWLIWI